MWPPAIQAFIGADDVLASYSLIILPLLNEKVHQGAEGLPKKGSARIDRVVKLGMSQQRAKTRSVESLTVLAW